MPLKIAAFPKCYIDQIAGERSMSVFDWIEMARSLDADGLEMYDGFFTSLEPSYLDQVGEAIAAAGFAMPMLCCSPDFTNPDPDARKRAVDREARIDRGGPPAGRSAHRLPGALRPALPGDQPPAGARVGRRLHQRGPPGRPRARHRLGPGEPLQGRLLEVSRNSPRRWMCSSSWSTRFPTAIILVCNTTRRMRSSPATTRSRYCEPSRRGSSACTPATDRWPRGRHSTTSVRPTARWAIRPTSATV